VKTARERYWESHPTSPDTLPSFVCCIVMIGFVVRTCSILETMCPLPLCVYRIDLMPTETRLHMYVPSSGILRSVWNSFWDCSSRVLLVFSGRDRLQWLLMRASWKSLASYWLQRCFEIQAANLSTTSKKVIPASSKVWSKTPMLILFERTRCLSMQSSSATSSNGWIIDVLGDTFVRPSIKIVLAQTLPTRDLESFWSVVFSVVVC